MAKIHLRLNSLSTIDVTVVESDKYSSQAYLKLERNFNEGNVFGCNEVFLTPIQLELIGRFLIRQADAIRTEQSMRKLEV